MPSSSVARHTIPYTPSTMEPPEAGHFHAVRFYESPTRLCQIVADFVGHGLRQGLPAVVIARPEHVKSVKKQLRSRGFDVARLESEGDVIVADAAKHLAKFMVDGTPDPNRFRAATIPLIERARRGRVNCVTRAYGEMVDLLWQSGQMVSATKLEMLWNELAATHDFALLCGYSMGHFYKDAATTQIYKLHSHVVSDAGEAVRVPVTT